MTQNLDYDLPTGNGNVTISSTDTDLTSDQTGLTITGYTNATGVGEWGGDNAALKYYSPGLYVYTTPTEINRCPNTTNLSNCSGYGWKEWQPGDDEHYLAGNYYSWAAATAGTGKDLTTDAAVAPGSICPKNWKLPLSGGSNGSNNDKSGSFYYLLNSYGYNFRVDNGNTVTDLVSSTGQNIATAPLYFLRGGLVSATALSYAGIGGYHWSRTVLSGTNAFSFDLYGTGVYPSTSNPRHRGFSIRCLVI